MDEYFGESPHLKLETANDSDDGDDDDNGDDGDDSDNEEEEEGPDDETMEMEVVDGSLLGAYPQPTLRMAVHPTARRVAGGHLVSAYGTTDLIQSLTRFLKPFARQGGLQPVVLLSDTFDVWHKLTLHHQPIPFASNEPLHHDVLRIRLAGTDQHDRQAPGVFDTTLFLHQSHEVGLKREFFFHHCRTPCLRHQLICL
jgi:hypothetical protein